MGKGNGMKSYTRNGNTFFYFICWEIFEFYLGFSFLTRLQSI